MNSISDLVHVYVNICRTSSNQHICGHFVHFGYLHDQYRARQLFPGFHFQPRLHNQICEQNFPPKLGPNSGPAYVIVL